MSKTESNTSQESPQKKVPKSTSFQRKASLIKVNATGEEQRPHIIRTKTLQNMSDKLYSLMDSYMSNKVPDIQRQIVNHVEYTLARTRFDFKSIHAYQAAAHAVRDRLLEYYNDTHRVINYSGKKKIYYMSIEFLIGRAFQNALINLNVQGEFKQALKDLGYSYEKLREKEVDAGLGNGGLGRLAACFLDSLATLNYPAWGYGIRYDYGIFKQFIKNGYQCQAPDFWLAEGNPWEIERVDVEYKINFYGNTREQVKDGKKVIVWQNCEIVVARAYDFPIPGYATFNTIGLRLWKSLPLNEFDFGQFNSGEYYRALQAKQRAQYITSVLYPNDSTEQGKQLRLKQEYLLCSATIQDIIRRHKAIAQMRQQKFQWKQFAKHASIQLNDTHPALSIVQFMRILVDEEGLDREAAWEITYNTFSYTNHTVMPQALQKWSVGLLGHLLPRHLQIIYDINYYWMQRVKTKVSQDDFAKMSSLSIIQQSNPKNVRMANLSIVGSHKVNGVAALHSQLLKKQLFKDFYDIYPDKFTNVTNGVTTRRWLLLSNPLLAELYTETLNNDEWLLDTADLKKLQVYADKPEFQSKWQAIKQVNKNKLVDFVRQKTNISIDPNSLFDVQIKRIHEYKRQLMNILYVVHRYFMIRDMTPEQRTKVVPRTVIFAGKAAPGYANAKKIIKFINEVSQVVNNDELTNLYLKCLFIPNYNVSSAQVIIPATQLSQHISTAGTEASGTSNMKFVLNGSLIIGTMDGANIQIFQEVKEQNIFIFGATQEQVHGKRDLVATSPPDQYIPESIKRIIQATRDGLFGQRDLILSLFDTFTNNNDWYLVTQDFEAYIECQNKVDDIYRNRKLWTKMSILNAVRSGKFSSDRTIREYSEKIWHVEPCKVIEDISKTHTGKCQMRENFREAAENYKENHRNQVSKDEHPVIIQKIAEKEKPDHKQQQKQSSNVTTSKPETIIKAATPKVTTTNANANTKIKTQGQKQVENAQFQNMPSQKK